MSAEANSSKGPTTSHAPSWDAHAPNVEGKEDRPVCSREDASLPSWRKRTRLWRWAMVTVLLASPILLSLVSLFIPEFAILILRVFAWLDSLGADLPPLMLGLVVVDTVSLTNAWIGALTVCICVTAYLLIASGRSTPKNRAHSVWSVIWRSLVFLAAGAMTIILGFASLLVIAFSSSYARLTPVSEQGCELWTSTDPYFDDWYTGDIYVRQPGSLDLHHVDDWRISDKSVGLEQEMHLQWTGETATLYVGLSEYRTPTNGSTTFKRMTVNCQTLEHRSEFLNEERARG